VVKVGLVGCGNIGSHLAREIQRSFGGTARLIGLHDVRPAQARQLARSLRPRVPVLSLQSLVNRSDLLIEAASAQAVTELLPLAIRRRRAMLILSTGALLRKPQLLRRAVRSKTPLYLPSGALAGLDGVKGAAVGRLRSVTLTTRKPPRALAGAPGILRRKIHLERLRKPMVVFQGSARRAAAEFPQNINVAATLALAGLGPVRTKVKIIADPRIRTNIHEVEAIGDFGRLTARTENVASADNPKTSRLAIQSAAATLRQILQPFKVGT